MAEIEDTKEINRRSFFAVAVASIAGFISLGIKIPSIIYIVGPALQQKREEEWISLGSVSKVEVGVPALYKVKVSQESGWITSEEEISVYVVTQNGRDYLALSNICTHLGCRVRWISDQNVFFCPCHNGVFDEVGAVVSGPPPKPLDQYELKIEGDQLFIKVG